MVLRPPPLKCPELWIVPPQNHFVPPHINNRCIGCFMYQPMPMPMPMYVLCNMPCNMQTKGENGGREGTVRDTNGGNPISYGWLGRGGGRLAALLPDPTRTPGPVQPKKLGRWRKN